MIARWGQNNSLTGFNGLTGFKEIQPWKILHCTHQTWCIHNLKTSERCTQSKSSPFLCESGVRADWEVGCSGSASSLWAEKRLSEICGRWGAQKRASALKGSDATGGAHNLQGFLASSPSLARSKVITVDYQRSGIDKDASLIHCQSDSDECLSHTACGCLPAMNSLLIISGNGTQSSKWSEMWSVSGASWLKNILLLNSWQLRISSVFEFDLEVFRSRCLASYSIVLCKYFDYLCSARTDCTASYQFYFDWFKRDWAHSRGLLLSTSSACSADPTAANFLTSLHFLSSRRFKHCASWLAGLLNLKSQTEFVHPHLCPGELVCTHSLSSWLLILNCIRHLPVSLLLRTSMQSTRSIYQDERRSGGGICEKQSFPVLRIGKHKIVGPWSSGSCLKCSRERTFHVGERLTLMTASQISVCNVKSPVSCRIQTVWKYWQFPVCNFKILIHILSFLMRQKTIAKLTTKQMQDHVISGRWLSLIVRFLWWSCGMLWDCQVTQSVWQSWSISWKLPNKMKCNNDNKSRQDNNL